MGCQREKDRHRRREERSEREREEKRWGGGGRNRKTRQTLDTPRPKWDVSIKFLPIELREPRGSGGRGGGERVLVREGTEDTRGTRPSKTTEEGSYVFTKTEEVTIGPSYIYIYTAYSSVFFFHGVALSDFYIVFFV